MSVTKDEMTAHIEASEARTDTKFEAALRHNDVQFERIMRRMDNMQGEIREMRMGMQGEIREVRESVKSDTLIMKNDLVGLQSETRVSLARQRVWFMIMGVSIVISTVTILEFLGSTGQRHAPVVLTVPQIEQYLSDN